MRRVGEAVPKNVTNVVQYDGGRSVRLRPQATPYLLPEQGKRLRRSQENRAADSGGIEALRDQLATGENTKLAVAQTGDQRSPLG